MSGNTGLLTPSGICVWKQLVKHLRLLGRILDGSSHRFHVTSTILMSEEFGDQGWDGVMCLLIAWLWSMTYCAISPSRLRLKCSTARKYVVAPPGIILFCANAIASFDCWSCSWSLHGK
eukprot:1141552-Pelagomonas_calceolata.AAC.6